MPLRRYSKSKRSSCPGAAGIGRAHFADQLGRALIEADHRALGVAGLAIEVEYVFHAGDIGGVALGMHHMSLRQGFRSFSARRRPALPS